MTGTMGGELYRRSQVEMPRIFAPARIERTLTKRGRVGVRQVRAVSRPRTMRAEANRLLLVRSRVNRYAVQILKSLNWYMTVQGP